MANPFAPEVCHELLLAAAPRGLAFDPMRDFRAWRQEVAVKLREVVEWTSS